MKITLIILFSSLVLFAQRLDPVKEYFDNGKLKAEYTLQNGVREGIAKFYYESGNIKEETNYTNGRVEGFVKRYYENGNVKETFNIEGGKREGSITSYSESGELLANVDFSGGKRIIEEKIKEPVKTVVNDKDKQLKTQLPKKIVQNNINQNSPLPPSLEDKSFDNSAYFLAAEVMPEPLGGMGNIYRKLNYPKELKDKGIQGIVEVLAFINEYGEVVRAEVTEGIHPILNESARMAVFYTKFKAGRQNGEYIKMQITVPVEFKIFK